MFTKKLICKKCESGVSKKKGNEGLLITVHSYDNIFNKDIYIMKVCNKCAEKFLDDLDDFTEEFKEHLRFLGKDKKHFIIKIKKEY